MADSVFSMPEHEATRTKITNDQWHSLIRAAWYRFRHESPGQSALRLMWAMWALETANGDAMWNYNFGNMTPGAASTQFANGWMWLKTAEGPMKFASYPSGANGAFDWLRYFNRPAYSPGPVFAAFNSGDAAGLAHQLKLRGYYGNGSEDDYRNGLIARSKLYKPSSAGAGAGRGGGGGLGIIIAGAGLAWLGAKVVGGSRS